MAEIVVNKWERAERMDLEGIIRFQILVHCHLSGIRISDARLECLTLIGINNKMLLTPLTNILAERGIFTSPQSARNVIWELIGENILIKEGTYRKEISLSPTMKVQNRGTILLDIKCLCRE
jgi:hypothetical protein